MFWVKPLIVKGLANILIKLYSKIYGQKYVGSKGFEQSFLTG